ncbi:MAG: hypothetical protein JXB18_09225 [Sedimentisphaerales bacterium]|nr:hypothetical protein [Sedimentisphaerales bacterium]
MKQIALIVFLSAAACVSAAEYVFDLTWQDSGFGENLRSDRDRNEPFVKEPQSSGGRVYRGQVWLGEKEPSGFIWLKQDKKFYIDLNQDGDLTNDPNGILDEKTREGYPSSEYEFEPFTIQCQTEFGTLRYVVDLRVSNYNESYFYPYFTLRSGFKGTMSLNGRNWAFSAADMPGASEAQRFLCCLADSKEQSYRTRWTVPEMIFVSGANYTIKLQWAQKDGTPLLQAVLADKAVAMGQMEIPGKEIRSLSLQSANTILFPEISETPVAVPAGQYRCRELSLKGKEDFRMITPQRMDHLVCTVPENGTGQFKAGAPLNHTVDVVRSGNTLKFSYKLAGIGGEEYDARQVAGYDDSKKPKVEIYKGDMLLASGDFEFG